jgi:putative DNA primase/helicase
MASDLIPVKTSTHELSEIDLSEIIQRELARFQPESVGQIDLLHGKGMLLNDAGNAQRLIAMCGNEMRYCFEMRRWLIYNGQRWIPDPGHLALSAAKSVLAEYYGQASSTSNREHEQFARHSMNQANLRHMLASAESELPVSASQLDAHPYLLNCRNGVLDLQTKQLRPHDPGLLLTKLVHHDYRPDAEAPRFRGFLDELWDESRAKKPLLRRWS